MADAIFELVSAAGWKLRTLIRTRRFYTDADLVVLYKTHLLSFLEYRTPTVYHATRGCLRRLDAVQSGFLKDIGVEEVTALVEFHLAPLSTRRDIAMLGLIHRTALCEGPQQFHDFFKRHHHDMTLHDPHENSRVAIYNVLPHCFRAARSVSAFQALQEVVTSMTHRGIHNGQMCPLHAYP